MDINKKRDDVKKVDGTNYGCPVIGFYDFPLVFLERLNSKHIADDGKSDHDFNKSLNSINIADTMVAFILNMNIKTDISPRGIIALLGFVHESINKDIKNVMQKVFKNCIKHLCSLIREDQLLAIQEWPKASGGDVQAVNLIAAQILRMLNLPFS